MTELYKDRYYISHKQGEVLRFTGCAGNSFTVFSAIGVKVPPLKIFTREERHLLEEINMNG